MNRPEFMVEDRVWFIPDGAKFAILATIIGISRSVEKGSFYFYDLDEPVGHSVPEEDLCLDKYKDVAKEALLERAGDFIDPHTTLDKWRQSMVNSISGTYPAEERWPWMDANYYPDRTDDELIYIK